MNEHKHLLNKTAEQKISKFHIVTYILTVTAQHQYVNNITKDTYGTNTRHLDILNNINIQPQTCLFNK